MKCTRFEVGMVVMDPTYGDKWEVLSITKTSGSHATMRLIDASSQYLRRADRKIGEITEWALTSATWKIVSSKSKSVKTLYQKLNG